MNATVPETPRFAVRPWSMSETLLGETFTVSTHLGR
jgi:hypothetical protein